MLAAALMGISLKPIRAEAAGTSFIYRGSLSVDGSLANGSYDLKSTLFGVLTNGAPVAPAITNLAVLVTNGAYTLSLDFGANAFNGEARWLELAVRSSGDEVDFERLAPRQELGPQPYSLYAFSAGQASLALGLAPGTLSGPFLLTNSANSFSGSGSGLTALNADSLSAGTVPDSRLSGNVALLNSDQVFAGSNLFAGVNSFSNSGNLFVGAFVGDGSGLTNVATTNYVTESLENVALKDQVNFFSASQVFLGNYNEVHGESLNFHRPNVSAASWIRFFRDDDTNVNHYCALGMDFAMGGYYWSFYDSAVQEDLLEIGVDPPYAGRFRIGRDDLKPWCQLSIHDLDANISNSLEVLSFNDGAIINSRNSNADMLSIQRDGLQVQHWLRWYQGDGTADWRVGMGINSYNLEFWNANGASSSSATPGSLWMSLNRNPSNSISFYVPISGNGSGLTGVNAATLEGQGVASFWQTCGNSSTTPGPNFLGTSDNQPLELKVNGTRAFRLEPNAVGVPNVIAGGPANVAAPEVVGASIGGGQSNSIVLGTYSTISGGFNNSAGASYATIPGGAQANARAFGQMAYATGQFSSPGDAQSSVYVCRGISTNNTPAELFLDGGSARILVPTNSSWGFDMLVTARSSSGNSASFQLRGAIKNNGGNISFVGSPAKTGLGQDVASWDVNIAADPVNQALIINVTGQASTTIRWVASVRTVEVGF